MGHEGVDTFSGGIVFGVADEKTVEGIVPHPVVGEEDEAWRQTEEIDEVEMGLMVADEHRRLVEVQAFADVAVIAGSGTPIFVPTMRAAW